MADQFASAIAGLQESLRQQEKEVREIKRVINKLCAQDGKPPLYPDAEQENGAEGVAILRDTFYGLSMPVAIKKYLESRRAGGRGPATVAEIIDALTAGGFKFGSKDDAAVKTGIYVSLAKNSYLFHRIRGGRDETAVYGLKAWYPGAKDDEEESPKKAKGKGKKSKVKPTPRPRAAASTERPILPYESDPGTQEGVVAPAPAKAAIRNGVRVSLPRVAIKGGA